MKTEPRSSRLRRSGAFPHSQQYINASLIQKMVLQSGQYARPRIAFGSMVEFLSISAKDLSTLPNWYTGSSRYLRWIRVVCGRNLGRRYLGRGDVSEIYVRRLSAKEVLTPKNGEQSIFPFADELVKLAERDQVFRTSTLIQDHLAQGEKQNEVLQSETDKRMTFKLEMVSGIFLDKNKMVSDLLV